MDGDKKEQKTLGVNPGNVIKTTLFTKPLTKFMLLLIIQLIAIGIMGISHQMFLLG